MKLDASLIRLILLEIEREDDTATEPFEVLIDGRSQREVSYHVHALEEAGLIEAFPLPPIDTAQPDLWEARHLLWSGHQYLAAIRDDTVWKATLEKVAKVGGSATLEILKATALGVTKQLLGLPG